MRPSTSDPARTERRRTGRQGAAPGELVQVGPQAAGVPQPQQRLHAVQAEHVRGRHAAGLQAPQQLVAGGRQVQVRVPGATCAKRDGLATREPRGLPSQLPPRWRSPASGTRDRSSYGTLTPEDLRGADTEGASLARPLLPSRWAARSPTGRGWDQAMARGWGPTYSGTAWLPPRVRCLGYEKAPGGDSERDAKSSQSPPPWPAAGAGPTRPAV